MTAAGTPSPLRLLALVTDAFGHGGGIAQYNRDFLTAAEASGVFAAIDILPRAKSTRSKGTHSNALASEMKQWPGQPNRLAYALHAARHALTRRPDVIFCGHLYMMPLAAILAKILGAKLLLQLHGIDAWDAPGRIHVWAANQADMIFCVSRYTRARALNWLTVDPSRVVVLPNTVGDMYMPGDKATAKAAFDLDDVFVLLSVTRLDKRESYKGIDSVIRLLPSIAEEFPTVRYLVSGDGDDLPRLKALADELGVAHLVRFLGFVPFEQLSALYRAADLFILPSTGEGFGIVYLEAMASGAPALGLKAGGAIDALGDGALGAAPEPDDLLLTLRALLEKPPLSGQDLSHRVQGRFGRQVFSGHLAALFHRLANQTA